MRPISPAAIPVGPSTASGVNGSRRLADLLQTVQVLGERPDVDQVLLEEHVGDRQQQQRVRAGADEVVLVGLLGGAGAARIDDHDLAPPLTDPAQPAAHVGRRHQAAVGGQRVGAEDDQVLGAVYVGDRDAEGAAEHVGAETCLGIWSTVVAVKMLRVPSALNSTRP